MSVRPLVYPLLGCECICCDKMVVKVVCFSRLVWYDVIGGRLEEVSPAVASAATGVGGAPDGRGGAGGEVSVK